MSLMDRMLGKSSGVADSPPVAGHPADPPQLPTEESVTLPRDPGPVDDPTDLLPGETSLTPKQYLAFRALQTRLLDQINLDALHRMKREELEPKLRGAVEELVRGLDPPLSGEDRPLVVSSVLNEVLGLGPLERLLADPEISDILVNGPDTVYVERHGKLYRTQVRFQDDQHLMNTIERIVSAVGRRVDEATPMVDARLADGSRVNAIIPPLALNGPVLSIRRFGRNPIRATDMLRLGFAPAPVLDLIRSCVAARLNILVSGGTGTGKTTLLNVMSGYIPAYERIITIEDAAELRLQQRHVVRLETRPANLEGEGEVTTRDLVRNALRMRPDRILVGEIRGDEAVDMLAAMNTGHEGSIGTIHANSPRHALHRLETMVGLALGNVPGPAIRESIAEAIDVIVQVHRHSDGVRRLVSVTEVTGMENGVVTTQELFRFQQRTVEANGRVRGVFEGTGIRPEFAPKLAAHGIEVPAALMTLREEV